MIVEKWVSIVLPLLWVSVTTRPTRFWTIHIRCSRRSSTAALTSGRMPLAHSCIIHSSATSVPERPTPALKRDPDRPTLTPAQVCFWKGWWWVKVRPAVHHSRPQARNDFQVVPHLVSEGTERRRVFGDSPVRPGRVIVVCDYPACRTVPLKHKRSLSINQQRRLTQSIKNTNWQV